MTDHPTAPGRPGFTPALLDQCISCGFCLPACPTYQLTGREQSSPRGRINLMRALQTGELPPDDPTLAQEASLCLGCRACEPVCPAGVQYGTLLEQWRDQQWRGRRRPLLARLLMALVRRRWPIRPLGLVRRHARTRPVAPGSVASGSVASGSVAPGSVASGSVASGGSAVSGSALPGSAVLMLGCVERVLFPGVSRAARALDPDLAVPAGQGCCGALHAHNGDLAGGERMARELGRRLPGTIVTTSGGCAAHLAAVLGRDRVREFSAHLLATGGAPAGEVRVNGRRARLTLQDSCHLRNALAGGGPARTLLAAVGDYRELPEAGICCGAAGTYSLLRPRESRRILAEKLDRIEALGVDVVVTVNPGCQRQLAAGLRRRRSPVRAVPLAELLATITPG